MAIIEETISWPTVRKIHKTDSVGGEDDVQNQQLEELGSRTKFLKKALDSVDLRLKELINDIYDTDSTVAAKVNHLTEIRSEIQSALAIKGISVPDTVALNQYIDYIKLLTASSAVTEVTNNTALSPTGTIGITWKDPELEFVRIEVVDLLANTPTPTLINKGVQLFVPTKGIHKYKIYPILNSNNEPGEAVILKQVEYYIDYSTYPVRVASNPLDPTEIIVEFNQAVKQTKRLGQFESFYEDNAFSLYINQYGYKHLEFDDSAIPTGQTIISNIIKLKTTDYQATERYVLTKSDRYILNFSSSECNYLKLFSNERLADFDGVPVKNYSNYVKAQSLSAYISSNENSVLNIIFNKPVKNVDISRFRLTAYAAEGALPNVSLISPKNEDSSNIVKLRLTRGLSITESIYFGHYADFAVDATTTSALGPIGVNDCIDTGYANMISVHWSIASQLTLLSSVMAADGRTLFLNFDDVPIVVEPFRNIYLESTNNYSYPSLPNPHIKDFKSEYEVNDKTLILTMSESSIPIQDIEHLRLVVTPAAQLKVAGSTFNFTYNDEIVNNSSDKSVYWADYVLNNIEEVNLATKFGVTSPEQVMTKVLAEKTLPNKFEHLRLGNRLVINGFSLEFPYNYYTLTNQYYSGTVDAVFEIVNLDFTTGNVTFMAINKLLNTNYNMIGKYLTNVVFPNSYVTSVTNLLPYTLMTAIYSKLYDMFEVVKHNMLLPIDRTLILSKNSNGNFGDNLFEYNSDTHAYYYRCPTFMEIYGRNYEEIDGPNHYPLRFWDSNVGLYQYTPLKMSNTGKQFQIFKKRQLLASILPEYNESNAVTTNTIDGSNILLWEFRYHSDNNNYKTAFLTISPDGVLRYSLNEPLFNGCGFTFDV
jgi:hypothetical protein